VNSKKNQGGLIRLLELKKGKLTQKKKKAKVSQKSGFKGFGRGEANKKRNCSGKKMGVKVKGTWGGANCASPPFWEKKQKYQKGQTINEL